MEAKQAGNAQSRTGVIVIPARLDSTRLKRKLLLNRTGRPLLAHTIERALVARAENRDLLTDVVVACDDQELADVARRLGVTAVITKKCHACGTSRVAEAVERLGAGQSADFVLNLQADQPEISPEALIRTVRTLVEHPSVPMATIAVRMMMCEREAFNNPNVVKVVLDRSMRAVYFSRAPIPFDANDQDQVDRCWYQHIGVYAYRMGFLREFATLPTSELERREDLEQLRALDHGATIKVVLIPKEWTGRGIDTEEDYSRFVERSRFGGGQVRTAGREAKARTLGSYFDGSSWHTSST
jgi:3-deoxy-manno-octulosonate cytidylyltransferase (CMP-KDO synthetase)